MRHKRSSAAPLARLTIIFDNRNLDIMNVNLLALAPKAAEAESFLKALANRHRLMVLCQLHGGELSVTKLQEAIGLSQSSLSQHLARLREDKLVKTRRENRRRFTIPWPMAMSRGSSDCSMKCSAPSSAASRPNRARAPNRRNSRDEH